MSQHTHRQLEEICPHPPSIVLAWVSNSSLCAWKQFLLLTEPSHWPTGKRTFLYIISLILPFYIIKQEIKRLACLLNTNSVSEWNQYESLPLLRWCRSVFSTQSSKSVNSYLDQPLFFPIETTEDDKIPINNQKIIFFIWKCPVDIKQTILLNLVKRWPTSTMKKLEPNPCRAIPQGH